MLSSDTEAALIAVTKAVQSVHVFADATTAKKEKIMALIAQNNGLECLNTTAWYQSYSSVP